MSLIDEQQVDIDSRDREVLAADRPQAKEAVDHPLHYGGKDDCYECIKVIEAWNLGFHLGNALKYIARADKKGDRLTDLKKASWYLLREIAKEEAKK